MDEKFKKEISKMEAAGLTVIIVGKKGNIEHVTGGITNHTDLCDSCPHLHFVPDPDPFDSFRDDDQKALCEKMELCIANRLGFNELTNLKKPIWCPYLDRPLTKYEERIYDLKIKVAKEDY